MTDVQAPATRQIPNEPVVELPPLHAYPDETTTPARTNGHHPTAATTAPPPHDPAAEAAALGAALINPDAALAIAALGPTAFYTPGHRTIATAITALVANGTPIDPTTVNSCLADTPDAAITLIEIIDLAKYAPTSHAHAHTARVRRLHAARQIEYHAQEAVHAARQGDPDTATIHLATAQHAATQRALAAGDTDPDFDTFLAQVDDEYDWIVPGLLEHRDRVILTAVEGTGKSTLLRQIAVQLASGVAPFTLEPIEPRRVLYVDCENTPRQARRALTTLRAAAGDHYTNQRLRLRILGEAMSLANPTIEADLAARILDHEADIVILGPLYKLITDDPIKEQPAKAVADAIDRLRNLRGSAFLIEAHSPYAEGSNPKNRPIRPYGASLWSRWPEFGLHLDDEGHIKHWRGQREARAWPTKLQHDQPWPWAPSPDQPATTWDGPTECADAIVAFLEEAGGTFSVAQIEKHLRERGRGYRTKTVGDAARLAHQHDRINRQSGPKGALMYSALTLADQPFEQF